MKILTAGQFRDADKYTIEHEPVASVDLMERAATALTDAVTKEWGTDTRFVLFAGPGNNGGDALAMARLLAARGYHTLTYLFNTKGTLSEDCLTNRNRLAETPEAELVEVTSQFDFPLINPEHDVVVDGLFGTGLNKPLNGGFALVVRRINEARVPVVSIDCPSGLMCEDNTFNDMSTVVRATLTLTLQLPKPAFFFAENHRYVGRFRILPIGLLPEAIDRAHTIYYLNEADEMRRMLRPRPLFAHKGMLGHALLMTGSYGMAGAAILAARACLRSGVGKLTVHTPARNLPLLQTTVPEAIVLPDAHEEIISLTPDTGSFQAVGVGPGVGTDEATAQAFYHLLRQQVEPLVVDADALRLLAAHPEWMPCLPADSILTPHPGELEALVGKCTDSYDRLCRARQLAGQWHLYIIVKGHYTQICTPSGDVLFNPTGNPGMATAGSGDVLTGLLTGLLAQGHTPHEAACLGVWLHGAAGDIAAARLGQECMLAGDLINALPEAFRTLKSTNPEI